MIICLRRILKMIIQKKKFYLMTDDLMFKLNLEKNPDALKVLAKKYIKDLKDFDINEEIQLMPTENINGIYFKTSNYDVKFKALDKTFDIEMQENNTTYNIEDRFLKYYADLNPIHTFKIKDEDVNELNRCGSITIVEIEKFNNSDYNVDIWDKLFMVKEPKELDSLKGADKVMDNVIKTCKDINDDAEMWRLLDEDHARRNIGAERKAIEEKARAEGMAKGLKEGLAKGMNEGLQQGVQQGKLEIAKNLKEMGISLEQIINATGLSKEEIEKL
jgi:hypothetical protein